MIVYKRFDNIINSRKMEEISRSKWYLLNLLRTKNSATQPHEKYKIYSINF